MKLYKLTDQQGFTQKGLIGETKWEEGFTLSLLPTKNPQLCTPQVIHAYKNLNLGLLLNPAQANIQNPLIWECEGNVCIEDWGKVGVFSLTTIQKVEPPKWFLSNTEKKRVAVKFAVACAKAVLPIFEDKFPKDLRPRKAIEAALAAYATAYATAYADTATDAAAYAATYAADAVTSAATNTYADTTYAATDAAYAGANAANYKNINFGKLADNATKEAKNETL